MSNTLLGDEQSMHPIEKGCVLKYQLKIKHLFQINKKLNIENEDLKQKILKFEQLNERIGSQEFQVYQFLDQGLRNTNKMLKNRNQELSKQNQKLLTTILLNQQLSIEMKKQSQFYVSRYQQKIIELRQNLQLKEIQIQNLQEKLQRYKGLNLSMNVKNMNRFTLQILKYQTLIQEMIRERNKHSFRNISQMQMALNRLNQQSKASIPIPNKKAKSSKTISTNACTQVRPNIQMLQSENNYQSVSSQKLEILFLRLHLQLRELKKKYKERMQQIAELKTKDKIMKQGYNTITKEIQKIRNQNCQLRIQLQHLDKKIKTSHEISRVKSVGNINRILHSKDNVESRVESELSIQGNLSDIKNQLKVTLPYSKYQNISSGGSKSHNFDQKIQNIEGILSLDSNPQFQHRKQKLRGKINDDDQQLSVCEQNQVDVSISLDTSGFLPPERSHHEISQHILTGLIDRKIF